MSSPAAATEVGPGGGPVASAVSQLSQSRRAHAHVRLRLNMLPHQDRSGLLAAAVPAAWADPLLTARRQRLTDQKRRLTSVVVQKKRLVSQARHDVVFLPSAVNVLPAAVPCPRVAPVGVLRAGASLSMCDTAVRAARSPAASAAVSYAFAQLGDAYTFTTRSTGDTYDCSSLVARAYRDGAGVDGFFAGLPNTAGYASPSTQLHQVDLADAKPGDIIIWYRDTIANSGGLAGHAQLYLGDGWIIQSGGGGDSRVNVDRFRPGDWKYVVFAVAP